MYMCIYIHTKSEIHRKPGPGFLTLYHRYNSLSLLDVLAGYRLYIKAEKSFNFQVVL